MCACVHVCTHTAQSFCCQSHVCFFFPPPEILNYKKQLHQLVCQNPRMCSFCKGLLFSNPRDVERLRDGLFFFFFPSFVFQPTCFWVIEGSRIRSDQVQKNEPHTVSCTVAYTHCLVTHTHIFLKANHRITQVKSTCALRLAVLIGGALPILPPRQLF